ncbi:uncharacterized protein N7479_004351 [Penicillium vulpinum]|uniref:Uncharacterized protein n=1 Tax=Penicillium vulpinum TaxID=29845 RepID=A0A1V6SBM9_9EURO|nr:uncharacterized protein N7479_004351 [Penicillium vulpinum]KAJ5964475.1 hypothetical protein N7479_004351 [Penicillium vulpinum]OQE11415.1 hypothetical protein PENVUL_c002G07358 [Penicillium vulpinum]
MAKPDEKPQLLRRSSRIAEKIAAQIAAQQEQEQEQEQARKAEMEARATYSELSQSGSSHTGPALKHACFVSDGPLCNICNLAIDQCVKTLDELNLAVDDGLSLTGDELEENIRTIFQVKNDRTDYLRR